MTVQELIEALKQHPSNAEVCIYQQGSIDYPGYNAEIFSVKVEPKDDSNIPYGRPDTTPVVSLH